MRGFVKPLTRQVQLVRGEETITLILHPLPLAYHAHVLRVFPAPVEYVGAGGGAPVAKPIESAAYEHGYKVALILIAKSLRGEVQAKEPKVDDAAAWGKYAEAIKEEFAAAGFVEGDINVLKREVDRVNAGLGSKGKDAAPLSSTPAEP